MAKKIFIHELNTVIEIFTVTQVKDDLTGESTETDILLGGLHTKRIDVSGEEELNGKMVSVNIRKYICRYNKNIMLNGTDMYIVDEDGKFDIHFVESIGSRYMLSLKCSKRA